MQKDSHKDYIKANQLNLFTPFKSFCIYNKRYGYSIAEEGVKIRFSEILKVNVFSRSLFERNYMHGSISIESISFSRNCGIKKQQNAKSVMDAFI